MQFNFSLENNPYMLYDNATNFCRQYASNNTDAALCVYKFYTHAKEILNFVCIQFIIFVSATSTQHIIILYKSLAAAIYLSTANNHSVEYYCQ